MPDLFNIPPTLSPRLAWIKKHEIKSGIAKGMPNAAWAAWKGDVSASFLANVIGFGQTEDEALVDLAKLLGVPLWNEEKFVL